MQNGKENAETQFKCGDTAVTIEFAEGGKTLEQLLIEYFSKSAAIRDDDAPM